MFDVGDWVAVAVAAAADFDDNEEEQGKHETAGDLVAADDNEEEQGKREVKTADVGVVVDFDDMDKEVEEGDDDDGK